jgi:hypothetical protein
LIIQSPMQNIRQVVQETQKIELDLVESPAGILDDVRALPYVFSASAEKTRLVVDLAMDADYRTDLARALFRMGVVVRGMKVIESSLEDVFITLTESYVNDLASSARSARSSQQVNS